MGQGRAGQGCGELETVPAAASLGWGLMALRGLRWGPETWAGWGVLGEAGQGQRALLVPSKPEY